jgi:CRP/FNR family transcriptional regulator, cyclic AMP receptor protein
MRRRREARLGEDAMKEHAIHLSKIGLFQGLEKGQLEAILEISTTERFAKETVIFEEGEAGGELYLILKGKIRISRHLSIVKEEALAVLEEGQAFGEMAVIEDCVLRSATARAHDACTLLVLKKEPFQQLLRNDRELAHAILWNVVKQLSSRLRATTDKMMLLLGTGLF